MTGLNPVSKHIMYPREINLDPVTIVLLIVEYTANVPTVQNTVFCCIPIPLYCTVHQFICNVSKYWPKYRFSLC